MDSILKIIAEPETSESALLVAIKQLGDVTEPPTFWTNIANSEAYSPQHRRLSIFALFMRHVSVNMSLSDLAVILDRPSWLLPDHVRVVNKLGGKIPVSTTAEDTVFVISVFPQLSDEEYGVWSIYMRGSGKQVDATSLYKVLQGQEVSAQIQQAKILELSLFPKITLD